MDERMTNSYIQKIAAKSKLGKKALQQEMRDHSLARPNTKIAALGGEQDTAFEQSFASLAYAYIQDKAPGLLDYMVGFQLVDRNEDNTKAVGIFGFSVGDQWIYAPVFFLSGDLKGHELLYLKNQDSFVPMKENWVNYVLARRPSVLGERVPENAQDLGVLQPNLQALSTPPTSGGSKFAAYIPPKLEAWAKDAMPKLASWVTKHPHKLEKFAGLDERLSLENFLREDPRLAALTMDMWKQYPGIKTATCAMHGNNLLSDALKDMKAKALETADDKEESKGYSVSKKTKSVSVGDKKPVSVTKILVDKESEAKPKVEILSLAGQDDYTDFSDEDKAKILKDGYLVKDYREVEEISIAYDTTEPVSVTNPDISGVYDLLVKPGDYEKSLVIHRAHDGKMRTNNSVVVRLGGKKSWGSYAPSSLFVKEQEQDDSDKQSYASFFKGLADGVSLKKGSVYVALTPSGDGTLPFSVDEVLGDGSYRVWYSKNYNDRRPSYLGAVEAKGPSDAGLDVEPILHFNNRKGSRLRAMAGGLYLPEGSKIIKLKESKDDKGWASSSPEEPIRPGNLADVKMNLIEKTSVLKVWSDHNDVIVNKNRLSKMSAFIHLVREHGFQESQAKAIIKQASTSKGYKARVKYAFAPTQPEYTYGSDPMAGGVPTTEPQVNTQVVPEMSAANTDPAIYDPKNVADPMAMQVAQEAQQSGQKEIFDTAMIGSMLKSVRQDSIVDRYLGDLMKALDRLGRIIFMFYWHNEEFADRYGKQDMPELEDTIRNSFEVLGDLVLFLKQKTIEPNEGGLELGEPDIEDSARI